MLLIILLDIGQNEGHESLLDHFGEGSVEGEVVEIVDVLHRLGPVALSLLLAQGRVALLHRIHVDCHRMVSIHNGVLIH